MDKATFKQSLVLITLDNDEQGLFLNGTFITCTEEMQLPDLGMVAEQISKALTKPCVNLHAPRPDNEEWGWHDVEDMLTSGRAVVTIIVARQRDRLAIHFCSHRRLCGADNDLWFPLSEAQPLFEQVEHILCLHGVAHNVIRVEPLGQGEENTDYRVVYNLR
ncbi:hypothetical protein [Nissabacter sp. SGAir0207]|uniref:hypothetical protein n=1 Tax=Nissabacter sp. SGAir0207 TaxID=2126321 RepID=UPI0010CD5343|nr:hypothetical protein [Nissabacter sp. SGAir0207]QCR38909.1 hypothetical protein C1N62_22630 [Nissabacter sp. SGAir0207]